MALISSLALHSHALAHVSVEGWREGLISAIYALRLVTSLRTLSLVGERHRFEDERMRMAIAGIRSSIPAVHVTVAYACGGG